MSQIQVESLESRTLLAATPIPPADWPPEAVGIARIGRTLYVKGTEAADVIRIVSVGGNTPNQIRVELNLENETLAGRPFRRVLIDGLGGNDNIQISPALPEGFRPRRFIIRGGAGLDTINGGAGREWIIGGDGNDVLNGGGHHDRIDGEAGNDTITGGPGGDLLYGDDGDDTFHNNEAETERARGGRDVIFGGPGGTDRSQDDPSDLLIDVERNDVT